ncbi:MAG TPA: BglG family transcription antiterminator, partial [Anaerovoracaceae bacterium]|nr:BglG family transcription antiterminator [Anaerovoracaceae bacterium]
ILMSKSIISINELADDFAVSSRTIRNDYKIVKAYLDGLLKKPCLELNNNDIRLLLSDGEAETIHKSINLNDYYLYKLSSAEREMIILSELLYNSEYITIESLAEKMFVSRGTINKDLVQVRKWCDKNSVEILFKKARGLKVVVGEKKRRSVIAKLIRDYNDSNAANPRNEIDICKRFFKNVDLEKVKDLVAGAENEYQLILSDAVFEALTIHIGLSVERRLADINVELDNDIARIEQNGVEYQMAAHIVSKIEAAFHVKMPETEIYYIALHLLGKAVLEESSRRNDQWLDIQIITTNLIKKISLCTGHRFENDVRLNEGLYHHLLTALVKLRYNAEYKNPFKEQMLKEYPGLYQAVQANAGELEYYGKVKLSNDEIAYIVLHFAASIERNKQKLKNRRARVIILCSTGIGTSRMVQSRVMQCFQLDIVKVLSLHQLKQSLACDYADFIISTVSVKAEIPVIQVSPLLNEKEIQKISDLLIDLGFGNYLSEPPGHLQQDISGGKGSNELMLSDVLREEYISLEDHSKTWKEAVGHSGEILLKNGVITRDYIDAAIKTVEETGPYIVITKGVAIPHASNKFGVSQTAISFVRLGEGVDFGNEQNDPVRYVFMLATVDSSSHLIALSELVTLLTEGEFYRVIDSAASAGEIVDYIKRFEQRREN